MVFSDDILQPMTVDQLGQYRAKCAQQLPYTLRGHHFLLLQEQWIRQLADLSNQAMATGISDKCKYKFHVHRRGLIDNCTFVAITETAKHTDEYMVFLFTLEADCTELRECIQQTKRIKWNFSPMISSVHMDQIGIVIEFIEKNKFELEQKLSVDVGVWLPKETVAKFDIEIPDDIFAAPLNDYHMDTINNFWSQRNLHSRKYLSSVMQLGVINFGLFDAKTNELQAWVLTNYRYAMAHVYTMESARRRGLGKLLVQMWCKEFVKRENSDPIAYISSDNVPSRCLYESLGFKVFRKSSHLKLNTFKVHNQ